MVDRCAPLVVGLGVRRARFGRRWRAVKPSRTGGDPLWPPYELCGRYSMTCLLRDSGWRGEPPGWLLTELIAGKTVMTYPEADVWFSDDESDPRWRHTDGRWPNGMLDWRRAR